MDKELELEWGHARAELLIATNKLIEGLETDMVLGQEAQIRYLVDPEEGEPLYLATRNKLQQRVNGLLAAYQSAYATEVDTF